MRVSVTAVALLVVVAGGWVVRSGHRHQDVQARPGPTSTTSDPAVVASTAPTPTVSSTATDTTATDTTATDTTATDTAPRGPTSTSPSLPASSTGHASTRPAVTTTSGHWWGVDSSGPITAAALANVKHWYRGARPQFWGRYLIGSYRVSRAELAYARAQHLYVYLIVNDQNCSGCGGGDSCGNDRTSAQARADALGAARSARRLAIPAGTVLFKDIEQVSSCHGEPTADYLITWHRTLAGTSYRTGFYGNTYRQYFDFPVAYCKAVARSAEFAADVVLDMNEPEPQLGAPRGTIGPKQAPGFHPSEPSCTPPGKTVIWQYGESIDEDNLTDIDQALPSVTGLLAPDGSIS